MSVAFTYETKTPQEILEKVDTIGPDNILGIIGLVLIVIFILAFINYLFPICHAIKEDRKKRKAKLKRKSMIKQIALQKEIEEEIEKTF